MPLAIEQFNLEGYDLVISSSHAVAKGIITGPNQLHICYCHSPMRYAWDLQHQYLMQSNLTHGIKSWIIRYFLHKLRIWDIRTGSTVDYFIANSKYIARRINKIYRRESTVIYPPVSIHELETLNVQKDNYFITVSRLVPYKKVDLIVEAFKKMPHLELVVIGDGPDYKKIKDLASNSSNIKIMGYQSNEVMYSYLSKAQAFVFAAEEDFGIIPVEAQLLGCPVIAYNQGGAIESVVDYHQNPLKATGLLFDKQDTQSIIDAVGYFITIANDISIENCQNNALEFNSSIFKEKIINFVNDKLQIYKNT